MRSDRSLAGWTRIYLGLIAFSLAGSLASALTDLDPGFIRHLASVLTLLSGVLALLTPMIGRFGAKKTIGLAVLILLIGATSEIIGLYTGYPFGRYVYTENWWPTVPMPGDQLFPLPLPFAWFLMVCAGYLIFAEKFSGLFPVLLGAALVTLANLPMEWAMLQTLNYWTWTDPSWPLGDVGFGVPILNSVGWFLTASIAGWVLHAAGGKEIEGAKEGTAVLLGIVVLMLGLGLIGLLPGTEPLNAR